MLAQHLAQQQQLKVMAAGGNVGSRWWHRAGSSHFHPSLPAYTPTELITLICLCSLPWDHLRFVRAGIETFCPQTVRQLLKTKQSPTPCVHQDLVKCPQWYKCFPLILSLVSDPPPLLPTGTCRACTYVFLLYTFL